MGGADVARNCVMASNQLRLAAGALMSRVIVLLALVAARAGWAALPRGRTSEI